MALTTKRPQSIDEQIAAITATRASRKANLENLRANADAPDNSSSTLEAMDAEARHKEAQQKALEAMEVRRNSELKWKGTATLEQRLLAEGRRALQNKFLFEMCYNAHWADNSVKEKTVQEMYDAFNDVLDTVDEIVPQVKRSMDASTFLYSVNQVLEAVCKKATKRIMEENSGDVDPSKISFDLTPDEELEIDEKLSELGKDEIVELVRDKVLTVIQDEKEAGKEKDEMFKQLREEVEAEDDEDDDEDPDNDDDDDDLEDDSEDDSEDGSEGEKEKPAEESTAVTEGALREPAPDEFYKVLSDVMRPMGKDFPKANCEKYTNPATMKKKSVRTARVFLGGNSAKKAVKILKASGFKEGTSLNPEDFLKLCGKSGLQGAVVGGVTGLVAPELMPVAMAGMYIASLKAQRIFVRVLKTGFAFASLEYGTTGIYLRIKYKEKLSHIRKAAFKMENGIIIDMTPEMQYQAALEQMQLKRELTARSGETLFESMMMLNSKLCAETVVEEGADYSGDMVMQAAFMQTVFEYTVIETMNTLGLYQFSSSDAATLRKAVFETVDVEIDDAEEGLDLGEKTKNGMKAVRINTKKMKTNTDAKTMGKHSAIDKKITPRFQQS